MRVCIFSFYRLNPICSKKKSVFFFVVIYEDNKALDPVCIHAQRLLYADYFHFMFSMKLINDIELTQFSNSN